VRFFILPQQDHDRGARSDDTPHKPSRSEKAEDARLPLT